MNLEPPQPPTPPAPAVRPTPPTPPRIDKTPFVKNQAEETDSQDKESKPATQDLQPEPQNLQPETRQLQPDFSDRGQEVLREFKEMDAREAQAKDNFSLQEEKPAPVPKLNYHEGHSGVFWVFAIIFIAIAAFVIVKKFLITDKPQLTKSQLFEDSTERLKNLSTKKPAPPPKKDDDKGKHFEVRI